MKKLYSLFLFTLIALMAISTTEPTQAASSGSQTFTKSWYISNGTFSCGYTGHLYASITLPESFDEGDSTIPMTIDFTGIDARISPTEVVINGSTYGVSSGSTSFSLNVNPSYISGDSFQIVYGQLSWGGCSVGSTPQAPSYSYVDVVASDSTAPVFSGNAVWYSNVDNPDSLATIKASLSATDETDGDLTSSITLVSDGYTGNTTTVGNYILRYEVSDAAGNTSYFNVEVRVVDIEDPIINLTGSSTYYVEYGSSYTEPGATVSDNYYTGLSPTITGTVDANTLGTYYIYYNVTDPSGNVADQVIRTVIVRDTTGPTIELIGAATVYVEYGSTYTELGAEAGDNHDGPLTYTTSGTVNNSVLGTYTITYTTTDSSGNSDSVERTVIVRDTTAPVLTLNGASTIYIEFGDTYTEQGASWTDAYDGSGSAIVSGSVNVGVLGTYTITYNAIDSNNNEATPLTRTVIVRDTSAPYLETSVTNIDTYNSLHEAFASVVSDVVVLDIHDGDLTSSITYTVNEYATANNVVGVYDVTLSVTDSSGNTFTHSFTITINDDVEPTFDYTGYLIDEATANAMTQDQIRDHINNRS
jgi:hypothetical protein